MAALGNQYIFGEFSADEFAQFFVSPRSYVELPPFNEKASSISPSSGGYRSSPVPFIADAVRLQVCGEDYQHIRFGVDEVMSSDCERKDPSSSSSLLKVSSTLNPQAPEFILGCQPSHNALHGPPDPDAPDGAHFNSLDGPDSELPSLDGSRVGLDQDGAGGALGQRERKKKKKRPPGYYSYLEGGSGRGAGGSEDALVNGHAGGVAGHDQEEPEEGAAAEPCSPTSVTPVLGGERTCESPDESPLDLTSGGASSSSETNIGSSSSSSSSSSCHGSGEAPEGAGRTAEQPVEPPPTVEGLQSAGSGRQSPASDSASPLPPAVPAEAVDNVEESLVSNGPVEPDSLPASGGQTDSPSNELEQEMPEAPPTVTEVQSPPPPATPTAAPAKSWASLFHNSKPLPGSPPAFVEVKYVPSAETVAPGAAQTAHGEGEGREREGPIPMSEDPMALRLAELLENVKLIHKPVSLQPRGLINRGNWCYINATLQALIACPPMFHLMKFIPMQNETRRLCSSTPMIDSFVRLASEFSNMPVPPKPKVQGAGEKIVKDIRPGVPFEPDYMYKLLTVIKSGLSEKGRQEDAEEYLGCVLNGLQEEMLSLKKLLSPPEEVAVSQNGPGSQPDAEEDLGDREEEEGSEDEWEQVGPRNKTSITRQADFVRTPISDIFGGHIRSVVYQHSSKESATLQPFFTLQLDIQSEKVRSLQEALEALVARESVQGYTSKTKQEIEISRKVTLEELPPVLVLHLKRFVFEKTGGCQKLIKNIDYPIDLEISKDLLSPGVRSKIFKGQRTYRLFAVVYHHGNSATGGHYTTDVFHIGLNGWLRIDDQVVKVVPQYQVVKPTPDRTAYLLYYRRMDLM
ncbi:hypothetical protein GJAV_G00232460 [Gymnothorax javanicus]|nr:hypothetical protein GJAV_G00232460 [Gymnothorax javanicus]